MDSSVSSHVAVTSTFEDAASVAVSVAEQVPSVSPDVIGLPCASRATTRAVWFTPERPPKSPAPSTVDDDASRAPSVTVTVDVPDTSTPFSEAENA